MRFVRLAASLLLSAAPFALTQTARELLPGVPPPESGIVFVADAASSSPSLLQIHATEIAINSRAGGNFARSLVYAGPRSNVELKGATSSAAVHAAKPSFLIRLSGSDDPDLQRKRTTLVALDPKKDRRVVSVWSANVFGGGRARHYDEVPVEKDDLVGGTWLRLQPNAPLPPGEYAIVFLPKDPNLTPDSVYDFTLDAPASPATPQPGAPTHR